MWPNITRDASLHQEVAGPLLAADTTKGLTEMACRTGFIPRKSRKKPQLVWHHLGRDAGGQRADHSRDNTPASAPSGSQTFPMAGNQGGSVLFHMIRHCSPLAPGGPARLRASTSKLRPGGISPASSFGGWPKSCSCCIRSSTASKRAF